MYKVNELVIFRNEPDHTGILFNPADGKVFGLNNAGATIWGCLVKGMDEAAILEVMQARFRALPDNAAADLAEFIESLRQNGFLMAAEDGVACSVSVS